MHDVFISFSFEDQKKAEEIVNVLTSEYGISCWICTRDIDGGKRYKRLIPDAIRAAKVVVFLQSEDAVASKEIPKEIGLAFDSDKTIIPFRIDQAPLQGDLEYDLYGIEYIDGTIPTQEQRIHELACAIAKATGKPLKNTACAPAEAEAVLASGKVVCGEIFAGRETLMQEIHEAFSDRDVVFLHGMGGIGKSQLACQYWKKYRGFYTTVVFARYETDLPSLIADDRVFNVKGASRKTRADNTPQTDEEYARDKLKLMKQYTDDHTLIILDNYDTAPEPFFEEFIRDAGYRVLVTTRHEPPRSRYHVIPVREIDDDTLKKIFMEYANPSKTMIDEDDPEFDELFALTNRHTYTLELIAKYMEEDDAIDEIGEMVELLKKQSLSVLAGDGFDTIRNLFRMTSLSEKEQTFMRCLAMMPPAGVNQKYFKKWCGDVFTARSRLVDLSLVKINSENKTIAMHPIIREVVISELKPGYENCKEFLDRFTEDLRDYISWNYSADVKDMYFSCCENIRMFVAEVDANNFKSCFHMANFSCFVDKFDHNIDRLQKLLRKAEILYGNESAEVAKILHRIGWCYNAYGDNIQAKTILEKADSVLEMNKQQVPGEYIHCCCDLAKIYLFGQDNRTEDHIITAKNYLDKAKEIIFDPLVENMEIVRYRTIMYNVTLSLYGKERGNISDALDCLSRALSVAVSLKDTAMDQSYILFCIGKIQKDKCEYEKAIMNIENSLSLLREYSMMLNSSCSHGERHCSLLVNLAECRAKLGDNEAVNKHITEAYTLASEIFQTGHPLLENIREKYEQYCS